MYHSYIECEQYATYWMWYIQGMSMCDKKLGLYITAALDYCRSIYNIGTYRSMFVDCTVD